MFIIAPYTVILTYLYFQTKKADSVWIEQSAQQVSKPLQLVTSTPVDASAASALLDNGGSWQCHGDRCSIVFRDLSATVAAEALHLCLPIADRSTEEVLLSRYLGGSSTRDLQNADLWQVVHRSLHDQGAALEADLPFAAPTAAEYWKLELRREDSNGFAVQTIGLKGRPNLVHDSDSANAEHRRYLLDGVSSLGPITSTPDMVALYSPAAFPLVLIQDKDAGVTSACAGASSFPGGGRVVVFANKWFVESALSDDAQNNGSKRLLANSMRWAAGSGGGGTNCRPTTIFERATMREPSLMVCSSSRRLRVSWAGFTEEQVSRVAAFVPLETVYRDHRTLEGTIYAAATTSSPADLIVLLHQGGGMISADKNRRDAVAVRKFIQAGGGVVFAQTPWQWEQFGGKTKTDSILNHMLEPAGLAVVAGNKATGIVLATEELLKSSPVHLANAMTALSSAAQQSAGLIPSSMLAVLRAQLPRVPTTAFAQLSGSSAGAATAAVPSLRTRTTAVPLRFPIKAPAISGGTVYASQAQQQLRLITAEIEMLAAEPTRCPRADAVEDFPGEPQQPRLLTAHQVSLASFLPEWQSTGVYVLPGQAVSMTFLPDELLQPQKDFELLVRVGCHTDDLYGKSELKRWPRISLKFAWRPLASATGPVGSLLDARTGTQITVASPYGGPLYLEVTRSGGLPPSFFAVELSGGAVKMPWVSVSREPTMRSPAAAKFLDSPWDEIFNSNSGPAAGWGYELTDWETKLQLYGDAPFSEIETELIIFTLPTAALRSLDSADLQKALALWDVALAAELDLAAQTLKRKERIVADIQISMGLMHSGYPIMGSSDMARTERTGRPRILDHAVLTAGDMWGLFHELGHNRQRSWWTPGCLGEVTVNIFSLAAVHATSGKTPYRAPWFRNQMRAVIAWLRRPSSERPFPTGSNEVRLGAYAMFMEYFGVDAMKRVLGAYETLAKKPSNEQERWDEWVRQSCLAVGRDLRPFFELWAWPHKEENVAAVCGRFAPWDVSQLVVELEAAQVAQ